MSHSKLLHRLDETSEVFNLLQGSLVEQHKALHFSIPSCTYLSNCMILILALNSVRKLSNFGFPKASQCCCSLAAEIEPPRVHDRVSFGSNPVSGRTAHVRVMPAMNMAQLQHINPLGSPCRSFSGFHAYLRLSADGGGCGTPPW
jgi:hypothetical protein